MCLRVHTHTHTHTHPTGSLSCESWQDTQTMVLKHHFPLKKKPKNKKTSTFGEMTDSKALVR